MWNPFEFKLLRVYWVRCFRVTSEWNLLFSHDEPKLGVNSKQRGVATLAVHFTITRVVPLPAVRR